MGVAASLPPPSSSAASSHSCRLPRRLRLPRGSEPRTAPAPHTHTTPIQADFLRHNQHRSWFAVRRDEAMTFECTPANAREAAFIQTCERAGGCSISCFLLPREDLGKRLLEDADVVVDQRLLFRGAVVGHEADEGEVSGRCGVSVV